MLNLTEKRFLAFLQQKLITNITQTCLPKQQKANEIAISNFKEHQGATITQKNT